MRLAYCCLDYCHDSIRKHREAGCKGIQEFLTRPNNWKRQGLTFVRRRHWWRCYRRRDHRAPFARNGYRASPAADNEINALEGHIEGQFDQVDGWVGHIEARLDEHGERLARIETKPDSANAGQRPLYQHRQTPQCRASGALFRLAEQWLANDFRC